MKIYMVDKGKREVSERMFKCLKIGCDVTGRTLERNNHEVRSSFGYKDFNRSGFAWSDCLVLHSDWSYLEKLKKFREEFPNVGVVLITGEPVAGDIFYDSDGTCVMEKPFLTKTLIDVIEKVSRK